MTRFRVGTQWPPYPSATSRSPSAARRSSTASASTSTTASSWCSSARPAAASRRCCACSPGSRRSPAARSRSTARSVNDVESKDRDIAMVFQSYALYPHMTVRENMGFCLQAAQGRREGDRRSAWRTPSKILNLDPYLERYPARALGRPAAARRDGPRDRARSRRCSCSTSRCPTSTPSCAWQMRGEIKALHQRLKTTTVYVTHDQIEAMTMADRIVVMHDGRIEQIGDAARALRPARQPVRRAVHRLAGDERRRTARCAASNGARVRRRARRRALAAAREHRRRDGQAVALRRPSRAPRARRPTRERGARRDRRRRADRRRDRVR